LVDLNAVPGSIKMWIEEHVVLLGWTGVHVSDWVSTWKGSLWL